MPLAPHQVGRHDAGHEDKCRRCGVSCHIAVPLGHRVIVVPGLHCRFLQEDSPGQFSCSVYADRFARAPWCHHADVAGPLGYLAADCPYGTPGRGKERVPDAEFDALWPGLWKVLRRWGVPDIVDHERLLAMIHERTGEVWRLEPMWPDADQPFADAVQQMRLRPASPGVHA